MNFFFRRQSFLDFQFRPSKHERLQDLMQLTDHVHVSLFDLLFGFFILLIASGIEPVIEHF